MRGTVFAADEGVGFGVVEDLFGARIEMQGSAHSGGDVAQVTERGREMAFGDVGVGFSVGLN